MIFIGEKNQKKVRMKRIISRVRSKSTKEKRKKEKGV